MTLGHKIESHRFWEVLHWGTRYCIGICQSPEIEFLDSQPNPFSRKSTRPTAWDEWMLLVECVSSESHFDIDS
jgi:hypothetical protein